MCWLQGKTRKINLLVFAFLSEMEAFNRVADWFGDFVLFLLLCFNHKEKREGKKIRRAKPTSL